MIDVKSYKSCKWCGDTLSRVTWNSVFCSRSCMQGCTEHKQQQAAQTPLTVYLDRVAGNCLKGHPHPNKEHRNNNLMKAIKAKLSEVQALLTSRKDQILNN